MGGVRFDSSRGAGHQAGLAPRFHEKLAILAVRSHEKLAIETVTTNKFGLSQYNFGQLVQYWAHNVEWSAEKSGDGYDVVATGNFREGPFTGMYGNDNDPIYIKYHAIDRGGGLWEATFVEFRVGRHSLTAKDLEDICLYAIRDWSRKETANAIF
jgi:hypothetical protein